MKRTGRKIQGLQAADAALLDAFSQMLGLPIDALVDLAMATLASHLRVQAPECAHCPFLLAQIPQAPPSAVQPACAVIQGPWPAPPPNPP